MILFVDDEATRTARWREALAEVDEVQLASTAEAALGHFDTPTFMHTVRLVVLDLAMHTTGGLTGAETGLGRLTGDALRRRLRESGWRGPIVVLTNARDDDTKRRVEKDGDVFRRKSECLPSQLASLAKELLSKN